MSGSVVSLVFPKYINENVLRSLYTIDLFKGLGFFFSFFFNENGIAVSKMICLVISKFAKKNSPAIHC